MLCMVSSVALELLEMVYLGALLSMVTLYLQQRLKIAVMDMDCNRRKNLSFKICQGEVHVRQQFSFPFFEKTRCAQWSTLPMCLFTKIAGCR